MRRLVAALGAVVLGPAIAVAGFARPVQAMNYTAAEMTTWASVDSAQPSTPDIDPEGDVAIGTRRDAEGRKHTERAWFTFDLTAYRGQKLHRASLYTSERTVTDCREAASVQFWHTRGITSTTTWQRQPRDIAKIADYRIGDGHICPGAFLDVDVRELLTAAIARKDRTITFGIRMGTPSEGAHRAGRTVRKLALSISSNHVPAVRDLRLIHPDRPCGTLARNPAAKASTAFAATPVDPDPNAYPSLRYALWPVEHPDQRVEFTGGEHDLSAYDDGTVLAWTARADDYDDQGEWGRTCYLTVDRTGPAAAPRVSSRTYDTPSFPGSGGTGVAGTFVFDAMGDRSVTSFRYRVHPSGVAYTAFPKQPGGRAKVSITPQSSGPGNRVEAASVDAAGNVGPYARYEFWVRSTRPAAQVEMNGVGLTSRITMYSGLPEATHLGFSVGSGPETRLPIVDGEATSEVVFTEAGTVSVTTRVYAGRRLLGSEVQAVRVTDEPRITSDAFGWNKDPIAGTPGSFRFAPGRTGVVAYEYDLGGDRMRVEAGADGTAEVPWTPATGGYYRLSVVSLTSGGERSQTASSQFRVIDDRPEIFAHGGTGDWDGVGRDILVSLGCELPGVTGFVYRFDNGPEQTAEGAYTSVTVTPAHAGANSFTAWGILSDGSRTRPTTISIEVTSAPLVTVSGPYDDEPVIGRDATFAFRPAVPGVVSYRYTFDPFNDVRETVEAAADGSATLLYTPRYSYEDLWVTSVTADGTESEIRRYALLPATPSVLVSGSWSEWSPSGGLGVPGRFGFLSPLYDHAVKYLWRVDDGPVHEVTPVTEYDTDVPYTPDAVGEHTLSVQTLFTDGVLSPPTEYRFLVGTQPQVEGDVYGPGSGTSGGPGVTGTFRFSGGMPGVVSYDYRIVEYPGGRELAAGTAAVDAGGAAQATFTPEAGGHLQMTVTGRTADGTTTDTREFSFGVA